MHTGVWLPSNTDKAFAKMDALDKTKTDRKNLWKRRVQQAKVDNDLEKTRQELLKQNEKVQLSQSVQWDQNLMRNPEDKQMNTTAPTLMQTFRSFNDLPFSPETNRVSLNSTEIQLKSPV